MAIVPSRGGNDIRCCRCTARRYHDRCRGGHPCCRGRRSKVRIIPIAILSSRTTCWLSVSILPVTDIGERTTELLECTVPLAIRILVSSTTIPTHCRRNPVKKESQHDNDKTGEQHAADRVAMRQPEKNVSKELGIGKAGSYVDSMILHLGIWLSRPAI